MMDLMCIFRYCDTFEVGIITATFNISDDLRDAYNILTRITTIKLKESNIV